VRVLFGRPAVGGPPGVPDAVRSVERVFAQSLFEIAQLAFSSLNFEVMILIDDGDPRGIVTAIFELAQSVDNQRYDLFVSNVSNYSTHKISN